MRKRRGSRMKLTTKVVKSSPLVAKEMVETMGSSLGPSDRGPLSVLCIEIAQ